MRRKVMNLKEMYTKEHQIARKFRHEVLVEGSEEDQTLRFPECQKIVFYFAIENTWKHFIVTV